MQYKMNKLVGFCPRKEPLGRERFFLGITELLIIVSCHGS